MGKKRVLILSIAILALVLPAVNASLIHGTLYDIGLDEVNNAVVEINTEPKQQMVAKNSTYFFNVPLGKYTISAKQMSGTELISSTEENITVAKEGEFVLDLILFPSFGEEEDILSEVEFDIETGLPEEDSNYLLVGIVLLAIVAFFFILRLRGKDIAVTKKEIEIESESEKVLGFIKKEGGRTTQKDIRKNFPQSEAKISLIIADLEDKGKLRKIKKGRGNIIILN